MNKAVHNFVRVFISYYNDNMSRGGNLRQQIARQHRGHYSISRLDPTVCNGEIKVTKMVDPEALLRNEALIKEHNRVKENRFNQMRPRKKSDSDHS